MKRIITFAVLFMVICLGYAVTGWAAGEGSGGGAGSPLAIVSSTVSNGEAGVNLDREIKFVFSKNIANISVEENNHNCFSMTDSSGNMVPIEVITFDDQLESEKKNDLIVKPEALLEGEQYTITISPDLQAKNGDKLGEEVTYTFSTIGYVSDAAGSSSQLWIYLVVIAVIIVAAFILIKGKKNAQ